MQRVMSRWPAAASASAAWIVVLSGTAGAQVSGVISPGPACEVVSRPGFSDSCGCGKARGLWMRERAGLAVHEPAGSVYSEREAPGDTDVLSNDIDIELGIAGETITGSNTIRVRSLVNGLTQFTYRLRGNFTVQRGLSGNGADTNRVTLNGATVAVCTAPPADNSTYGRVVTLDRAYNAGEEFTVRIDYTGTAVSRGFGSIEFQTQPGNSNPVVATLSEAYYAGTWWPAKDGDVLLPGDNGDKATVRLAVTAPNTLRTTANGLLESVTDLSGARRRYQWVTAYPTSTYLVAFCTTVYNTWTRSYTYPLAGGGTGMMPLEFNVYPASDTPANRAAWERTIQMLEAYRPVFGEYPFVAEKYGIYQFPFGGGMEHQTNSGQGTFDESVTAHELAHQWWGDDVTCKTWNNIWLNEGFATYSEALWAERKPGSSGEPALHAAMASRRPSAVSDSVYVYATNSMNRIFSSTYSYRKGAWVLHMLRGMLGDAAFFQMLADYRDAYRGSAATTDDFAAVASAAAGRDLTRYFQQWVYGIGAPAYAYSFAQTTIAGTQYTKLMLRQTQDTLWPGGGAVGSYFEMPVEVQLNPIAGVPSRVVVDNTARQQWFLIPASMTGSVTVDPDRWILETEKVSESYVQGPPRVVASSAGPGAEIAVEDAGVLDIHFSEPALAAANNYASVQVVGPSGSAAFTSNVTTPDGGARLRLTFVQSLVPGTYTVTVPATIAGAGGAGLDGEGSAFPTGDGLAGGAASWTFSVLPACTTDYNQDGGGDTSDVIDLANDIASGTLTFPGSEPDFNQDGGADTSDVIDMANAIASGSC